MKNKPIVIICGDPESIFNEILIKTLKSSVLKKVKSPLILIGSKKILEKELKRMKTKINLRKFDSQTILYNNNLYIVDVPLDQKKLS